MTIGSDSFTLSTVSHPQDHRFTPNGVNFVLALWIDLPLVARLSLLVVAGLIGGGLANHAIYTGCWFPRPISPWAAAPEGAAPRTWSDRLPLLGWVGLRREFPFHGRWFWVRPLLIEVALGAALPALYMFQCEAGGLFPPAARNPLDLAQHAMWLNRIYFGHACLLLFMTAATFIDFDEQTIPDMITVPGTILALVVGAVSFWGFMPVVVLGNLFPITFNVPQPIDARWFDTVGLWTGLAIWTGWCFALADRRVILRRGLFKGIEFFFAGLVRHPTWKRLLAIWIVGLVAVSAVWSANDSSWLGLFTALVGLAVGGGVIWAVRIVASSALGVEAMGFGDVTLMAMIGAVVGWQASLAAFFLAPIAAIAIVLVQYASTREPRVPFGPYLCAGTLLTILFWDPIANGWLLPNLEVLGPVLLWLSGLMLVLMGILLFVWRWIKQTLLRY